jgi:hypothetical protein
MKSQPKKPKLISEKDADRAVNALQAVFKDAEKSHFGREQEKWLKIVQQMIRE